MDNGKITPKTILHFNKKEEKEDNIDDDRITVENILDKASSDNVSDAMKNLYGTSGLVRDVKSIDSKSKVAGFIRTVETNSYDWGTGIKGIYSCKEDEILFIKCSNNDYAIWGGLASSSAKQHGVKATIIIGSSRDTEDILELGYPVFSQGIKSAAGLPLNEGKMDIKLFVDDMIVDSGDFAICDVDGVVIVPKDKLEAVIGEVNRIKDFERDCFRKVMDENQHLDEIIGL